MMKKWLFILIPIIGLALLTGCGGEKESATTTTDPAAAPDFALEDHQGNIVRLADFRGKVTIINFWATWCGPCREEIPGFVRLYDRYKDDGLAIIGISLDRPGWEVVRPFMEKYNINYPIVLGNQKVVLDYGGIQAIPTTFIVNRQGHIVDRIIGYRPEAFFEKRIKELL
ncbi:MAG: TlpA family protein disulfide reductase [Calditrichaeota bacterium]|nr:TlpA family protein disulfide reductase [Calditrichota bacterium]